MPKLVVYKSVCGRWKKPKMVQRFTGVNYVLFSGDKEDGWDEEIEVPKTSSLSYPDRRNAKLPKVMPWLFFDADYSLYLDDWVPLEMNPWELVEEFLQEQDIAVAKHPQRICLFDEVKACLDLDKDDPWLLWQQYGEYHDKVPRDLGLGACGILLRRHSKATFQHALTWWEQICKFSSRDQVSFPYACWKNKIDPVYMPISVQKHPGTRLDL